MNPAMLSHVHRILADIFSIPLEQIYTGILASKRLKAGTPSIISIWCWR